ncbi:MAG: hypothetical protein K8I30_24030 [Anaerolineae bacterium]|nr:hypothetical protein [Anaerolineae bacterium]
MMFIVVLAACAPEVQPTVIPATAEVTEEIVTPQPSATPLDLRRPTLPPTWTPVSGSEAQSSTVDPAQTPGTQAPTTAPQFVPATPLEVCNTFGEDLQRNKRTFTVGEAPQVFWTAVEGAASYSVSLIDETGEVLLTEYTIEPTITFDASLFEKGKLYGWEAYPIDRIGQQMCLGRGAELFPDE